MKQEIIAFAGRQQSGKSTAGNYLLGLIMVSLGITSKMEIKEDGTLHINDILIKEVLGKNKPKAFRGQFDVYRNNETMQNFLAKYLDPFVKIYSFADQLKQDICIGLLGLSWEGCYGTDEQKNELTHLKWEDMPGVITNQNLHTLYSAEWDSHYEGGEEFPLIYHHRGLMSNREVMKFVGSDVMRRMYSRVWSASTIRRIRAEGSALALITDTRFPDEVEEINNSGGKVIKLTRRINDNTHSSESSLDEEKYDSKNFYAVLDNKNDSIEMQCKKLYEIVADLEVIPQVS